MDIKINKDKFKKLLFKYLDSQDELKYANEHRTGYGNSVREFFYEYPNDGEDMDMDSDYEFVFTYFGTSEDYEEYHNITTPYVLSTYPLIEIDTYLYQKIVDLFGDLYAPQLVLEWLNKRYDLNAVSIAEN
jgi:hypothetical protein